MKKKTKKNRVGAAVAPKAIFTKEMLEGLDRALGLGAPEVRREPVEFDYTALNWDFIRAMAWIPIHAGEKYGSWEQYREARLRGEKSCMNHAFEHLSKYVKGEPYDKRDGSPKWHLVAAAYNCMMEWFYFHKFGGVEKSPLVIDDDANV